MLSMLSQSLYRSLIYWQSGNTEKGKDGMLRNKYSVIHRLLCCFGSRQEGGMLDNAAAMRGWYFQLCMHVNDFFIQTLWKDPLYS